MKTHPLTLTFILQLFGKKSIIKQYDVISDFFKYLIRVKVALYRVQVYVRKFKLCMKQVNITFSLLAALNLSSEKAIVKIKSILLITDSKLFFNSVS